MERRKDALVAAAVVIAAVEERAKAVSCDSQVATIGQLRVHSNAANAVPGNVVLMSKEEVIARKSGLGKTRSQKERRLCSTQY